MIIRHAKAVFSVIVFIVAVALLAFQYKNRESVQNIGAYFLDASAIIKTSTLHLWDKFLTGIEIYNTATRQVKNTPKSDPIIMDNQLLITALKTLEHENDKLRSLLSYVETSEIGPTAAARIIGRSGAPFTRSVSIDRGRIHGVERGDAVIVPEGVVGRVHVVGFRSSEVMLLTDTSSAIEGIVERTRAQGIVRGLSNPDIFSVTVNDFDRLRDVQVGDAIITSGIGLALPAGLPIGTITKLDNADDGMHLKAVVKPAVNLNNLEFVLVLHAGRQSLARRLKQNLNEHG